MPELLRIDMMKQQGDGVTSLSPQSPTTSVATSTPLSTKIKVLGGYATYIGVRGFSVGVQEIGKGGNEELATTLNNIATGVRIGGFAIATGGATLIPEGINAGIEAFTISRQRQRDNREIALNRELSGQLNGYMGGGGE